MARKYEFYRMGVNMKDDEQMSSGLAAYQSTWLIDEDATVENAFLREKDFVKTACLMSESITSDELTQCIEERAHALKKKEHDEKYKAFASE